MSYDTPGHTLAISRLSLFLFLFLFLRQRVSLLWIFVSKYHQLPSVIRSDNRSSAFHISSLILFLTLFVTFATYKTHTRYQGLTFFSSFIFFFFFFFFYFRRVFRAISGRYIEAEISLHTLLLSLPLLVCPSIKVTRESMAEADAVTVSYAARGENNSLAREFRSVSRRESRPNGRFACRLENGCTSETH